MLAAITSCVFKMWPYGSNPPPEKVESVQHYVLIPLLVEKTYNTYSTPVQSLVLMHRIMKTTNQQIELEREPLELYSWAPLTMFNETKYFTDSPLGK